MPSFDAMCEANFVELRNAVEQSNKEISNRFDFKGSDARIELKEKELILFADDDFKLGQVKEVLYAKCAKRSIDVRFFTDDKLEKMSGDKLKQKMLIKNGIETELSKKIVKLLKESKMKVQASIQGDTVRVTGAKRDDLQAAMALLKKDVTEAPLTFGNFRD
jgi:uncharacterized protein YajQ (UPF0234 family)